MSTPAILDAVISATGTSLPAPARLLQRVIEGDVLTVEVSIPPLSEVPRHQLRPPSLFGAIRDPRLRVRKGVPVVIVKDAGTVSVYCAEVDEFGYGVSLSAAFDDLGKTLVELFFALEENRERLSPEMGVIRERLSQYIERSR